MTDLVKVILRVAKIVLFVGALLLLINQFLVPAIDSASSDVPVLIQKLSTFLTVARKNINMLVNPYVVDACLWITLLRPIVTYLYKIGYWVYMKVTE